MRPWAARTIIFVAVLVLGTAIGAIVKQFVRVSLLSSMDRFLGFLFGFLRGAVALGVLAMVCHAVRLNEEHWYRQLHAGAVRGACRQCAARAGRRE